MDGSSIPNWAIQPCREECARVQTIYITRHVPDPRFLTRPSLSPPHHPTSPPPTMSKAAKRAKAHITAVAIPKTNPAEVKDTSPQTPKTPKTPADEGIDFFESAISKEGQHIQVFELRLDPDGGPNKDRAVSTFSFLSKHERRGSTDTTRLRHRVAGKSTTASITRWLISKRPREVTLRSQMTRRP